MLTPIKSTSPQTITPQVPPFPKLPDITSMKELFKKVKEKKEAPHAEMPKTDTIKLIDSSTRDSINEVFKSHRDTFQMREQNASKEAALSQGKDEKYYLSKIIDACIENGEFTEAVSFFCHLDPKEIEGFAIKIINKHISNCDFEKTLPFFKHLTSETNLKYKNTLWETCSENIQKWVEMEEEYTSGNKEKARAIAQDFWKKFQPENGKSLAKRHEKLLKYIAN